MSQIDIWSLDLNLLKVFEALYEEGGAGRAAIRLGVTQSAVSAALARLRQVYGDHLFERTGRGLRPTAKSEELRPVIAAALEKCRQSLLLVSARDVAFNGRTVALGLSDDHELAIGRRLIDRAKERAPGLRLLFRQTHSMLAADALMSRQIDLALTAGAIASRSLSRQLLASGGYSCVSALPGSLDRADYLRRGHVLVSSGGYVGVVDEVLAAQSLSRRVEASTTHFAALPALLLGSDCIATLPTHAARTLARFGQLHCLPCPFDLPRYAVELGWRADSARDPAIQLVLELVREVIADLKDSDLLAPG
ncbi:LysR family transcriptional regulator [Pseudomonas sp. zfem002]|uniref:LysR family transcriptional regulator n=1 Tax=Pseudomonas sp. zfem002 TaxID=3078197 RepID=UPI002928C7F9|nr:LysR family transcriptional regulator [Pseudomonas sp. zfem002]MDU9392025.1 LysR family transcriptional regulator [Pseudomonas sp. zfem002]